jgi:hypothetical protein
MPTPAKLIYGCVGFGALAFVAASVLQMPVVQNSLKAQRNSGKMNIEAQESLSQAARAYSEASAATDANLKSISHATNAFLSSNATTARLQFEGMANSLSLPALGVHLPSSSASSPSVNGHETEPAAATKPDTKRIKPSGKSH